MTSAWAQAWVRDVRRALNERDWVTFERLHHPDVVYSTPISECTGRVALLARVQALVTAVPDLSMKDCSFTFDVGKYRAVFETVETGTMRGDLTSPHGEIRATGQPFEVHAVQIVTFDDSGLATKVRTYFDTAEAHRQPAH